MKLSPEAEAEIKRLRGQFLNAPELDVPILLRLAMIWAWTNPNAHNREWASIVSPRRPRSTPGLRDESGGYGYPKRDIDWSKDK